MNLMRFLFVSFLLCTCRLIYAQANLSGLVNPFIGTAGHGHTFPGAVLPFGMVQLSPDTRADASWDGCSGYHYSDTLIYGFSHTHLSGTGCSDWGDILVTPGVGKYSFNKKDYASTFSHQNESATAGYYSVLLNKGKIKAELTATQRVGIHKYTFPKGQKAFIMIDLMHRDALLNVSMELKDSVTIVGYRQSKAWAKDQIVFFEMKLSKPVKTSEFSLLSKESAVNDNGEVNSNDEARAMAAADALNSVKQKGVFYFDMTDGKPLIIKVGISSTGFQGATLNLKTEASHWDFEKYKAYAARVWNAQLSKVVIEEKSKDKLSIFYTSLYHCFIHPSLNMDVDSTYRGRDKRIYKASNFTNYTVFSLWDTYRALHPLFTILERNRTRDFINSFLAQYQQAGRLPVWELSSNETDCMIGFHSVSVMTDALIKGIKGIDTAAIYKAMVAASNYTNFGIPEFNKKGFLQIDDESESVSRSLEYAYDNWCIAQVARYMNRKEDERLFTKRSQAYKFLFDVTTGNMRPRKNGGWLSPFNANEINNHFTEGNSWHYSFYVPHDLEGLIKLHGGESKFETRLDELFNTSSKTTGREQADVTGLIGQYAHGNEPSHHVAYLYNYLGKPQKTISRVKQICNDFYKNTPDGLIGNDDCGQMSAWYVFSSLGMYPVCPGSPQYALSEPLFKSVKVFLEDGKSFTIENTNPSKGIVKHTELNGSVLLNSFLNHENIMNASSFKFIKDDEKKQESNFGKELVNRPGSKVGFDELIPTPVVNAKSQVFKDKLEVSMDMINMTPMIIVYTLDGSEPTAFSKVYRTPFTIDSTCVVKAKVFTNYGTSLNSVANYYRLNNNCEVELLSKPNSQYTADGAQSLIDGIKGNMFWKRGGWLGFQYQDFECVADFKSPKELSYFSAEFLQDTRSWIIFPQEVAFFGSNDGMNYTTIATVKSTFNDKDDNVRTEEFTTTLKEKVRYRYVKVKAKNYGKLPKWHEGFGDEAFIFIDELEIR